MKRLGTLFTAASVAFAGTLLPTATASQAAPRSTAQSAVQTTPRAAKDRTINVIQANLDGGSVKNVLRRAGKGVDAVMLQELCKSQLPKLRKKGFSVVKSPFIKGKCKGGGKKFVAVATRRAHGPKIKIDLGTYGGRTFSATCTRLKKVGVKKLTVCSTHLALSYGEPGDPGYVDGKAARATQVQTLSTTLNGWIGQGRRVILTGDFNMPPKEDTMGMLYKAQGAGQFYEGDQHRNCSRKAGCRSMRPTTDGKRKNGKQLRGRPLDYFMVGKKGVNSRTLRKGIIKSSTAQHHIITGQVTFKP